MGMKVRVSAPFPGQALLCLRVVYFVSSFQAILNGHIERSHADPISSLDNSSTGPSIRIETFETEISVRPTLV